MRSLIVPNYDRSGTDFQPDDEPLTKLFRISMITNACSQEHKPCIRRAQLLFDEWMDSPDPLNWNKYIYQSASSEPNVFIISPSYKMKNHSWSSLFYLLHCHQIRGPIGVEFCLSNEFQHDLGSGSRCAFVGTGMQSRAVDSYSLFVLRARSKVGNTKTRRAPRDQRYCKQSFWKAHCLPIYLESFWWNVFIVSPIKL